VDPIQPDKFHYAEEHKEPRIPTVPEATILRYFSYKHLPEHLQKHSKPFCDLAQHLVATSPDTSAQLIIALNKLLEAKDCFVRAML